MRTASKVLKHLEESRLFDNSQAILHWCTGTGSAARRAVELGCYFSINEEMLRSEKHRKLISILPLERLLTETDGPFILHEGTPLRPRDVHRTVHEIALIHNLAPLDAGKLILNNLRQLVSRV